jgi:hypothetical protein
VTRETAPELTDILCESCGYRLGGLPEAGNCPECGRPIADSTTRSPRRPPAWETKARNRGGTFFRALLSPRRFFSTLNLHGDTSRSRWFAAIFLGVATLMNAKTIIYHYANTTLLTISPPWLPPLWLAPALPVLIGLFWYLNLELVAYLSAAEGKYWGLRLPRTIVRRALHYWTVHAAVVSIVVSFVPLAYLLMLVSTERAGLHFAAYLYTLSGAVVLGAFYLFWTYWIAMKSIMYGNFVQTAPTSPPDVTTEGQA